MSEQKTYLQGVIDGASQTAGNTPVLIVDTDELLELSGAEREKKAEEIYQHLITIHPHLAEQSKEQKENLLASIIDRLDRIKEDKNPSIQMINHEGLTLCVLNAGPGGAINFDVNSGTILPHTINSPLTLPRNPIPLIQSEYFAGEIVGLHEGAHCNQGLVEPADLYTMELTDNEYYHFIHEIDADRKSIEALRAAGREDLADKIIAFRNTSILNITDSPTHATGIFLAKGSTEIPTREHFEAAKNLLPSMVMGYAEQKGITPEAAMQKLYTEPALFMREVGEQINAGAHDHHENPHIKKYIGALVGSYETHIAALLPATGVTTEQLEAEYVAAVKEAAEAAKVSNNTHESAPLGPVLDWKADCPMTIGGVSMSEYFGAAACGAPVPWAPAPDVTPASVVPLKPDVHRP